MIVNFLIAFILIVLKGDAIIAIALSRYLNNRRSKGD